MTAMEKMVVEFEIELRDIVGKLMKRTTLNSARLSYGAEYLIDDESGIIMIAITNDDALKISFLKGRHSSVASEIYSTPDISSFTKADQTLKQLNKLIEVTTYEGRNLSIEKYAEFFKKDFAY